MFRTLIFSLTAFSSAFLIKTGLEQFRSSERIVEVRGLSERLVTSNEASWVITYSAQGNELNLTNQQYLKNQKVLLDFFKKLGFTDEEIQKSPANIIDNWANYYGNARPPNRTTIRGSVSVNTTKVNEVAKALDKTDELIQQGVTFESSTTNYAFTDLNKIKPEMIKEATANARESAQQFANDTESDLGKIKAASQGLFTILDANSDYESHQSITKKVRVVTQVSYYLN